jgi:hypothetical protein
LKSGLCTCKAGALLLEQLLQSIFSGYFLEMGPWERFAQAGVVLLFSWSQPPK